MDKIKILENKLNRQIKARECAEDLLENKSRELYLINQALEKANQEIIKQQEELILTEKLSSLGMLAAGLAHEINNPLGFIISNIDTLSDYIISIKRVLLLVNKNNYSHELLIKTYKSEDIDYILEDINEILIPIKDGLNRISSIVQNIRDYSKVDSVTNIQQININDLITSTLKIINTNNQNYEINFTPGKLLYINANSTEITQVFTNIIVNSIQALDKDKSYINIKTYQTNDDHIVISITDNGMGITDENKHKIFNPFFSTKDTNKNTGLGLAISSKIIKDHYGKIELNSTPGQGSEFKIILPIYSKLNIAYKNETNKRTMC